MSNKIKKLLGIIASFLAIGFIIAFASIKEIKASAGTKSVYVSSDNTSVTFDGKKVYVPDSSGQVTFDICSTGISGGDIITVSYRTYDLSAVSSFGNYDAKNGETKLTYSSPQKAIKVQTHNVTFQVNEIYNYFAFEIVSATASDNSTVNISENTRVAYGGVKGNNKYKANANVFDDYNNPSSISVESVRSGMDESWTHWYSWGTTYTKYPANMYDYERKYCATGLGYLGFGGGFTVDADHPLDADDDEFYVEVARNGSYFTKREGETCLVDPESYSFGDIYVSGRSYSRYARMPYSGGATNYIKIHFRCDHANDLVFYNNNFQIALFDDSIPTPTKWAVTQGELSREDYLYVYMKLNEPVHVDGNPILYCYVDSSSQIKVPFRFYTGSGTDTLVFRTSASNLLMDSTKNLYCKEIFPCELVESTGGCAAIFDYGRNTSSNNNRIRNYTQNVGNMSAFRSADTSHPTDPASLGCRLYVDADLRLPKVSVTDKCNSGINQTNKATIKIDDASEGATIYYSWTKSSEPIYSIPSTISVQYDYSITNKGATDNNGNSISITGSNLNGNYYLHVAVMSKFGNTDGDHVIDTKKGTCVSFDNTTPDLSNRSLTEDTFLQKIITFSLEDGPSECPSGVSQIYMYYTTDINAVANTLNNNQLDENVKKLLVYNQGDSTSRMIYDESLKKCSITLQASDGIIDLQPGEYNTFYIGFNVIDNAGNQIETKNIDFKKYIFDRRELFETYLSTTSSPIYANATDNVWALDSTNPTTLVVHKQSVDAGDLVINSIKLNGEEINLADYATQSANNESNALTFNKDVKGLFEVSYKYNTKISKNYYFYFSNSTEEPTHNKNYLDEVGELINYVYQLPDSRFFYKNIDEGISSTTYYGDCIRPASFSSKSNAENYVRYNEYKDLSIYYVKDQSWADALNSGVAADRMRAAGEDHKAIVGDYYIRYKKADWSFGDTTSSNWVYYFYSNTLNEINISALPEGLNKAIDEVVNTIVSTGDYVFLADENLNRYGSPYLDPNQYHAKDMSMTESLTGSVFKNAVTYTGDYNIFSSYVEYLGKQERLLTNYQFEFNEFTKLYYRQANNPTATYTEILPIENILRNLVEASGVFEILELDDKGISKFNVFIDKTAPVIQVTSVAKSAADEPVPQTLNAEYNNKVFSAKSFSFIDIIEEDKYSYIAVYRITAATTSLKTVFSLSDVRGLRATLESGYYLLKIYDRSGNNYCVYIKANDSDLEVKITENPNVNIKVECNREEDEIQTYQIYFNGDLIRRNYSRSVTFTENGIYDIYILDWFGNEFNQTYEFERTLPDIAWQYDNGKESYKYDGSQTGIRLVDLGNQEYDLFTNGKLSLIYPMGSDYEIEFIDSEVSTTKSTTMTGETMVKMNATGNFTVKISYIKFKDIYVIYNVRFDNTSPIVSVSSYEKKYEQNEMNEMSAYASAVREDPSLANKENDGKPFIPTNINYTVNDNDTSLHYIASGGQISSKIINVGFEDESLVVLAKVYLNDELLTQYEDYENGIEPFTLSRTGNYKIVAYDALENKSEFTFTNSFNENAYASVDGNLVQNNSKNYGNTDFSIKTKNDGRVDLLIDVEGQKYFYYFTIRENSVYRSMIVYDSSLENGLSYDEEFKIYSEGGETIYSFGRNEGLNLEFRYDKGTYCFTLYPDDGHDYNVSAKFDDGRFEPYYSEAVLSTKQISAMIRFDGKDISLEDGDSFYINDNFVVVDPTGNEDIEIVDIMRLTGTEDIYSLTPVYKKGMYYYNTSFGEEGDYVLFTTNKYGVICSKTITISRHFNIVKQVTLADNTTYTYSSNYNDVIYSNSSVRLQISSENPKISVTKDGNLYLPELSKFNGQTYLTFNTDGTYSLSIKDEFGNVLSLVVRISNKQLKFPEALLDGFNQKALLKEQGYTNQKISILSSYISINNISYISVTHNDDEIIIYDNFSESKVKYSEESLYQAIGNQGNGEYIITIRDVFGNKVTKSIHYSDESTLSLSRTTRSNGNFEDYDLDFAIENGFYANNTLRFDTTSTNYLFKVDDQVSELSKTLSFTQGVDLGTVEYHIYYLDEYGFEYNFMANLYRTNVEVVATDLSKFTDYEGILTTKEPFSVSFSKNASCTYTFNKETYDYEEGMEILDDGVYRFTVVDFAGNIASATYKKDSICEYTFEDTMVNKHLVSGDVANNNKVSFKTLNGDSTYLAEVYHDGKRVEDYKDDKFLESGHWELLIRDAIGNSSFFEFYIISHEIKGISYETPYTYVVTRLTYQNEIGGLIDMLGFVDQNINNSSFSFGSTGDEIIESDDGYYEVEMFSSVYGEYSTFNFTIENVNPCVELVGCEEGEETLNDITIKGYKIGDTIKVYKDGKLTKTVQILANSSAVPVISEGGEYVIEITNAAGLTQTLAFKRIHISNGAGSTLIIIGALAIVVLLFIGLVYRTKSKVDK